MSRASPQVKSEASAGALKLVYPPAWYPWGLPAPLLLCLSPRIPARQIKYLRKKETEGKKKKKSQLHQVERVRGGWNVTGLFLIKRLCSFFMFVLRKIKLTQSNLLWMINEWNGNGSGSCCCKPTLQLQVPFCRNIKVACALFIYYIFYIYRI